MERDNVQAEINALKKATLFIWYNKRQYQAYNITVEYSSKSTRPKQ